MVKIEPKYFYAVLEMTKPQQNHKNTCQNHAFCARNKWIFRTSKSFSAWIFFIFGPHVYTLHIYIPTNVVNGCTEEVQCGKFKHMDMTRFEHMDMMPRDRHHPYILGTVVPSD